MVTSGNYFLTFGQNPAFLCILGKKMHSSTLDKNMMSYRLINRRFTLHSHYITLHPVTDYWGSTLFQYMKLHDAERTSFFQALVGGLRVAPADIVVGLCADVIVDGAVFSD